MATKSLLVVSLIFLFSIEHTKALWCFECVSTQPGCGDPFNWIFLWSNVCPESNDVCVRITETKGAEKVITRSCLSTIKGIRTDVPADTYEGCRKAAKDVKLGHYVNNSIKELDIHRDFYDDTEYCFCFLDHRCNDSIMLNPSTYLVIIGSVALMIKQLI